MTDKKLSVKQKLTKARSSLVLDHPFFGSLILRLKNEENNKIQTARTDGKVFQYNSAWLEGMNLNQVMGLLAHEVMHLVTGHQSRRGLRKFPPWNLACDHAIDPILDGSGFTLPDKSHIDQRFQGMGAEQIYEVVVKEYKEKEGGECSEMNGEGDGSDQDPGGNGGIMDASPDGDQSKQAAADQSEQEWKIAAIQAAQQAKAAGNIPGAIEMFIEGLLEKQLDWKTILRDFIERSAKNDYTWQRPNPRYLYTGFILPGLLSQELGTIVIGVDTSGSVSNEELQMFATEISSILEEFQSIDVEVVYCDTKVAHTETFTYSDLPIKLNAHGGGGTKFTPVFDYIEKKYDEDPKAVIYFTDLWCSDFPKAPPPYPVLWIDTENRHEENGRVPFGEILPLVKKD